MSASLVGSEMCIRDRFLRSSPKLRYGALRNSPEPSEALRSSITKRSGDPVSYTHLTLPTICSV
eukprot:14472728-Alexandrium_andersonii.AAC.1